MPNDDEICGGVENSLITDFGILQTTFGTNVTLQCISPRDANASVTQLIWYRYENAKRRVILFDSEAREQRQLVLYLYEVTSNHSGCYQCQMYYRRNGSEKNEQSWSIKYLIITETSTTITTTRPFLVNENIFSESSLMQQKFLSSTDQLMPNTINNNYVEQQQNSDDNYWKMMAGAISIVIIVFILVFDMCCFFCLKRKKGPHDLLEDFISTTPTDQMENTNGKININIKQSFVKYPQPTHFVNDDSPAIIEPDTMLTHPRKTTDNHLFATD